MCFSEKKTRITITYTSVERNPHVGDVVCHIRTGNNCYIIVRLHIQEQNVRFVVVFYK